MAFQGIGRRTAGLHAAFPRRKPASALLAAAALLIGAPAAAQTSPEALDQRIRILERQLELLKEEAAKVKKAGAVATAGEKGLSVKKGDYELKLRTVMHLDARVFQDDFNPDNRSLSSSTHRDSLYANDTFLLRRVRPIFEGTLGPLVGFRIMPDFGGNSTTLVDAYADLKFDPAATLRVGKMKGPISLERLQSASALTFVERGFASELAPNRDIGVQLQGDLFGATLNYAIGVFNGTPDGRDAAASDVDNRKEYEARLFARPFIDSPGWLQGLGFGIAGSVGEKVGEGNDLLPRYRTPGQRTFFQYVASTPATVGADANGDGIPDVTAATTGVFADGTHTRISPQFYWYVHNLGLLGEYISSEQELARGDERRKLNNTAWQVVASYVLTGEEASYGAVKPASPFTIGGPGWGALEIALRYGVLEVDEDAFEGDSATWFARPDRSAQKATAYTVGLNWYLTSNVKTVLNYSLTEFDGGAAPVTNGQASDRADEKAWFARVQLAF